LELGIVNVELLHISSLLLFLVNQIFEIAGMSPFFYHGACLLLYLFLPKRAHAYYAQKQSSRINMPYIMYTEIYYSYQNILVENPRSISHLCHVHFHGAVTQLAVGCINIARSDSEVITVTIACIYTEKMTFCQKINVVTWDQVWWAKCLVSCQKTQHCVEIDTHGRRMRLCRKWSFGAIK
jgi:hypothetical protein